MFEVLKLSVSPGVLPLTVLLGLMIVFWIFCLLGSFDFDFLGFDGGEGGFDSGDGGGFISGPTRWIFRFFNGDAVPVAPILSFLLIFEWCGVMLGYHFHPPEDSIQAIAKLYGLALIPAILATKLTTRLIRPYFVMLDGADGVAKPVIGRLGRVRSNLCDESSGQVEVHNSEAPLLINARTRTGAEPLPRGTCVIVLEFNAERNLYLVESHPESK